MLSASYRKLALFTAFLLIVTLAACSAPVTSAPTVTGAEVSTVAPASVTVVTVAKLNLNTATGEELLATIPNFSNRMVREFEEYRPYVSITQFRREIGKYVDEAQIAEYEKYVYVPISINDSDAATLQQIPGLTDSEAADLMTARPYASTEAFLTKLAEYVNPDEVAIGKTYLIGAP